MDKLWTEEDYLSCWYVCRDIAQCFPKVSFCRYADADAEIHPVYDKFSEQHDAIIAARASARSRKFQQRVLGERRPTASIAVGGQSRPRSMVPGSDEPAAKIAFISDVDQEEPQWEEGFKEKRDLLIEHFNVHWDARKVMWLPFPGTKK